VSEDDLVSFPHAKVVRIDLHRDPWLVGGV